MGSRTYDQFLSFLKGCFYLNMRKLIDGQVRHWGIKVIFYLLCFFSPNGPGLLFNRTNDYFAHLNPTLNKREFA